MRTSNLLGMATAGLLLATAGLALAQPASSLKTAGPGETEFPACCDSCTGNSCTGCNSGPQGLSCGKGLVLAECSLSDNKVSCKKVEEDGQQQSRRKPQLKGIQ